MSSKHFINNVNLSYNTETICFVSQHRAFSKTCKGQGDVFHYHFELKFTACNALGVINYSILQTLFMSPDAIFS